jgi:SpoVK/Ycf46/Vps4 family AAA+-type ATPase
MTSCSLSVLAIVLQTNATFLKLAGPQLVQMFIGDGAKMVRDAFALAKEKQPAIIFIDEIDAIGTKRFDSELSGDREVQRTMLELLNQLDGFTSNDNVKVGGLVQLAVKGVLLAAWLKFTVAAKGAKGLSVCVTGAEGRRTHKASVGKQCYSLGCWFGPDVPRRHVIVFSSLGVAGVWC